MNQRIRHLIRNPFEVQLADVALLQDEIEKHPYFSTLRTLLLFAMKEFGHSSYLTELKKTSIYCPSRVALYHYLQKEQQISETQLKEPAIEETNDLSISEIETTETPKSFEVVEEIISQHEIIIENTTIKTEPEVIVQKVDENAEMTFSEWLNSSKKHIKSTGEIPTEKDIKYRLIDEFIDKSPRISPLDKNQNQENSTQKANLTTEYSDLMTETLAQIYVNQKKYDKAARAYKILSLKYPDKKDFFEEQTRKLEELKNS